jgi:hypothetical protein
MTSIKFTKSVKIANFSISLVFVVYIFCVLQYKMEHFEQLSQLCWGLQLRNFFLSLILELIESKLKSQEFGQNFANLLNLTNIGNL